jgi:hypothetical protein
MAQTGGEGARPGRNKETRPDPPRGITGNDHISSAEKGIPMCNNNSALWLIILIIILFGCGNCGNFGCGNCGDNGCNNGCGC